MQLLYIANRYEYRPQIEQWLASGAVVVCDRYLASSIAYGEAQGLDSAWLVRPTGDDQVAVRTEGGGDGCDPQTPR